MLTHGISGQVCGRDTHGDPPQELGAISPTTGVKRNAPSKRGLSGAKRKLSEARMSSLAQTIESEVIPRLMMAHKEPPRPPIRHAGGWSNGQGWEGNALDVVGFTTIVMTRDSYVASTYVDGLLESGLSLETVYLDLLAPAARRLGELWEDDLCYFTDVAVGLTRIHQVMCSLSPSFRTDIEPEDHSRRALIAPMPGEQHTFGLVMLVDFFRRAGWDVVGWPLATGGDLPKIVRNEAFDLVGLSVSCATQIEQLQTIIRGIRQASCFPDVRIMVGGRLFNDNPELVTKVGADATAVNGLLAVQKAEKLVASLKSSVR